MEFALSPEIAAILALAALFAGVVDTIAGGGGLITVPALLMVQIPPFFALGTQKLQGTFGVLTATALMIKKGMIDVKTLRMPILTVLVGSALGGFAVQKIDPNIISFVIPIVLGVVALYFLFSPQKRMKAGEPKINEKTYAATALPVIGFYDGFLGPGTGSFFCMTGIWLRGMDIIKATAHAKLFNFISNVSSLVVFIIGGKVIWTVAGIMIAGQIAGSWIGSHLVLSYGERFIRPVIVTVCVAMLIRYVMTM